MTLLSAPSQRAVDLQWQTNSSAVADNPELTVEGTQLEAYGRIGVLVIYSCFLFAELCHATFAEPWLGFAAGLLLCGLVFTQQKWIKLQMLDLAAILLSATALLSVRLSVYTAVSEGPALRICVLVMLYALLRIAGPSIYRALFWVLSAAAAVLSLIYGVITSLRYVHLTQAGFNNLVSFRDQFATLEGQTPAAWITIFLALLPFPMLLLVLEKTRLTRWAATAISTVILITIGLTFSRGLYLGTALFLLVIALGTRRCTAVPRTLLIRIFAPVILSGLLLLPVVRPLVNTLQMARTTSQTRSFSGRLTVWRQAESILKSHPVMGSGLGTFALQYAQHKDPSTPVVFSAFNIGFETLVEQGLLGALLWIALLTLAGKELAGLWMNSKSTNEERIVACFLFASGVSLLLRDASYASLSSGPVMTVLIVILAVAANSRTHATS